ncbi:DUF4123 domain-containing protein [Entomomonas sp. E2T0]|uniref:DUF4123 domain-containing protein n=1 Tax=Entomomonas sp. E2T0 TaxID=2930213 RepID=UPI00222812E2|nr:DUF4123 domain-containing protein [Entomomonas sp. E2T0]UYZ84877.1 DUF4123 domain-containing protein [Entomomonas sp. E2T0]
MISIKQWLALIPEDLTIYTLLGSVSDAKPVAAYFQKTGQINLTALWQETPYASWFEAMPYIAPIDRNSPFLEWVDSTKAQDWGWLAASPYDPDTIRQHLKGLTKVLMPDGIDAFFRYWDGRHLYPILDNLKEQAGEVIPVFSHYFINKQAIEVQIPKKLPELKEYPWWKVDQQLMDKLLKEDSSESIAQLLSLLKENDPDLYHQYHEHNLFMKAQLLLEENSFNVETIYDDFKESILGEGFNG